MADIRDAAPIDVGEELKKIPFRPVSTRIILKELKVEKINGIHVPETARGSGTGSMGTTSGVVIQIGPEVREYYAGDLSIGDIVYTGRFAMAMCPVHRTEYVFINDEDIMAVFIDPEVACKAMNIPDEGGSDE